MNKVEFTQIRIIEESSFSFYSFAIVLKKAFVILESINFQLAQYCLLDYKQTTTVLKDI